ncbi:hypothetical protein IMY05_017G0110800 [Salix suchowensis]|nr:hypothetical protein IMY05_017G0110800 [Salix suchowensis]
MELLDNLQNKTEEYKNKTLIQNPDLIRERRNDESQLRRRNIFFLSNRIHGLPGNKRN